MSERYSVAYDDVTSGNWFVCDAEQRNRARGMCTKEVDATEICTALNAANAAAQPKPEGETVDVRVAVAVNSEREWNANGYSGWTDGEMRESAFANHSPEDGAIACSIMTASLPVPTTPEIPATVEPAKEQA